MAVTRDQVTAFQKQILLTAMRDEDAALLIANAFMVAVRENAIPNDLRDATMKEMWSFFGGSGNPAGTDVSMGFLQEAARHRLGVSPLVSDSDRDSFNPADVEVRA